MNKSKEPMDRMMLTKFSNLNEYTYHLESVIITHTKAILKEKNIPHILVPNEILEKFTNENPYFSRVRFHQIGLKTLYEEKIISLSEYYLLIAGKRALNKRSLYLLREYEFSDREEILSCNTFQDREIQECEKDTCKLKYNCPKSNYNIKKQLERTQFN